MTLLRSTEKGGTTLIFKGDLTAISSTLSVLVMFWLMGCTRSRPQTQSLRAQAVPVTIGTAVQKSIPVEIAAIGNVEAYSMVEVRPQVTGLVDKVLFKEGQDVKAGDLLFTLDAQPFQAALEQLEANLARDKAQLDNLRAQADRSAKLYQDGIVSKDQYDSLHANAEAMAAAVLADEAAIKRAKIDLSYCSIYSPIDGRTGSLLVYRGNVVKANDTSLVAINQILPIYVTFAIPEKNLDAVKKSRLKGPAKVIASIPGGEARAAEGFLSFLDNSVDPTTGAIKLKATFSNGDNRLWPGQFVRVTLRLGIQDDVVIVPSQAVQSGQSGQYVFIIKPDMTAESRSVIPGDTTAGETVIEQGVQAGEQVVITGQLRLVPGAKVEVKSTEEGNKHKPS
jgi:membrane fusion protein, multidrug efflux system